MVNLLGLPSEASASLESRLAALKAIPRSHLHWYGKQEIPGRKVGHVTVLLEQADSDARGKEAESLLNQVREIWPNPLN